MRGRAARAAKLSVKWNSFTTDGSRYDSWAAVSDADIVQAQLTAARAPRACLATMLAAPHERGSGTSHGFGDAHVKENDIVMLYKYYETLMSSTVAAGLV